ncbi:MAG: hypothetical protein GF313_11915 [Caldithrix sp.]|nr:hypothetical protein [Caldithrix sp.]
MIVFDASTKIREKINGLKLGLLASNHFAIHPSTRDFDQAYNQLVRYLQQKFGNAKPSEDAVVSHVRRMYRRIGWEPTKYRPSSEKLIRRLLKGQPLFKINNAVDMGNIVSARFHLPMGLYDQSKIDGQPMIDVGRSHEVYKAINGKSTGAEGKMVLRDQQGIFGNPTADSLRTAIDEDSKRILAVFFCPPEVDQDYLTKTLDQLKMYYEPFTAEGALQSTIQTI